MKFERTNIGNGNGLDTYIKKENRQYSENGI